MIDEMFNRDNHKVYYEKTKIKEEIYMITFVILAAILGIGLITLSGVAALLLDPIIAIFLVWAIYKIVKMIIGSFKK